MSSDVPRRILVLAVPAALALAIVLPFCGPPRCGPPCLSIEPISLDMKEDRIIINTEVENWGATTGQLLERATLRSERGGVHELEIDGGIEATTTDKGVMSRVGFTMLATDLSHWTDTPLTIVATDQRYSSITSSSFRIRHHGKSTELVRPDQSLQRDHPFVHRIRNILKKDWRVAVFGAISLLLMLMFLLIKLVFDSRKTGFPNPALSMPEEDMLSRDDFAKDIAKRISSLNIDQSFTIAICAPWGAGKSWLLDQIEHALAGDRDIRVVEFRPWAYETTNQLIHAFIETLGGALNQVSGKARIRSALLDLESALLAVPSGPIGMVAALREKWEGTSLDIAQRQIRTALLEQRTRFVVKIDDLDRLDPDSLKVALKLTRLIAGFPRIVYLLAYDREQIEKSLGDEGKGYLEKFVQSSFEIPVPPTDALFSEFAKRIGAALKRLGGEFVKNDKSLLEDHWKCGLNSVVQTLRDINVIANSIDVTLPRVLGEVCLADFVALESLRIRRHKVHSGLRLGRDWIDRDETDDEKCNAWLDFLTNHDEAVKSLVRSLFPQLAPLDSNRAAMMQARIDIHTWERYEARRACIPTYFPRYFSLALAPDDIAQREIDSINHAMQDEGQLFDIEKNVGEMKFWAAVSRPDSVPNKFLKTCLAMSDDGTLSSEFSRNGVGVWFRYLASDRRFARDSVRTRILAKLITLMVEMEIDAGEYVDMCGPLTALELAWKLDPFGNVQTIDRFLDHAVGSPSLWTNPDVAKLLHLALGRRSSREYPRPTLPDEDIINLVYWFFDTEHDSRRPRTLQLVFPLEYLLERLSNLGSLDPELERLRLRLARWL